MKLNDVMLKTYLNGESLFAEIKLIEPFPFIGESTVPLDLMLVINHGRKTMFHPFLDLDLKTLAEMLVLRFKHDWLMLIASLAVAKDLKNGRTITETINKTDTKTTSTDSVNKVAAFNSETMLDDGGSNSSGLDDSVGETVRVLNDDTNNVKEVFNMLELSVRNDIIKTVLKDISGFTTLSIY